MKKALLLEANPDLRGILKHQLLEAGFEVEEAADGATALRYSGQSNYDLIVADIDMPIVDGLTFVHLFKIRTPGVPVIVLSAFSSMREVASGNRYGGEGFLVKPGEVNTLRAQVLRMVA